MQYDTCIIKTQWDIVENKGGLIFSLLDTSVRTKTDIFVHILQSSKRKFQLPIIIITRPTSSTIEGRVVRIYKGSSQQI
jgi:hypothetical protein